MHIKSLTLFSSQGSASNHPSSLNRGSPKSPGLPGGSDGKATICNVGDPGSIPGLGRFPGEGNGNPLQYSCLENPLDRGAWQTTVHGVAKSRTRLSNLTLLLLYPKVKHSISTRSSSTAVLLSMAPVKQHPLAAQLQAGSTQSPRDSLRWRICHCPPGCSSSHQKP